MLSSPRLLAVVLLLFASPALAQITPRGGGQGVPRENPWPMRYGNAARTGQSSALGPRSGQVHWKLETFGEVPHMVIGENGTIFLGTTMLEEWWSWNVYLTAINSEGGTVWRRTVNPNEWGMAQGIKASPAIAPDGTLIVPSTAGELLRVSATGHTLWTHNDRSDMLHNSSPAVLPDGTLRIYRYPGLRSQKIGDGQTLFSNEQVYTVASSVAVAPNGDMAIGGVYSNEPHGNPMLYYLDAAGNLLWKIETPRGGSATPCFGSDGTLYAHTSNITAYNRDQSVKWSATGGDVFSAPALSDQGIVYSRTGQGIIAHDAANGALLWSFNTQGSPLDGFAIDHRGVLYVTTTDGWVYAADTNGNLLFQNKVCDAFRTGPALGAMRDLVAFGEIGFSDFLFDIR